VGLVIKKHRSIPKQKSITIIPKKISIAITIAFSNEKSRIDFAGKIRMRFSRKNRDPFVKS